MILVLDSDQVPDPEILQRLVGFSTRRGGLCPEPAGLFFPEGDPFYNADRVFYETMQLSNDQANAVISCGSGVVYRRRALEELGGFATWNLVEDFTSSYEMVSRGWRGVYILMSCPGAWRPPPGRGLPPALPVVPGHHALFFGITPCSNRASPGPKRDIFSSS